MVKSNGFTIKRSNKLADNFKLKSKGGSTICLRNIITKGQTRNRKKKS